MKIKFLFLTVMIVSLSACGPKSNVKTESSPAIAHTGTGTLMIKPVVFNKDSYVREAVKNECQLTEKLTQFIEENAASQYANILTDSNSTQRNAQVLSVTIEEVQGGGGGAWSGAKVVMVKGVLTKNGRTLGDFKARRYSGGGMFGAYKGTCAILGRCVRTLGKDIANWLRNPTSKAVLGDL